MELSRYFSEDWYSQMKSYLESPEFEEIAYKIANERETKTIYPEKGSDLLFKVFKEVPLKDVKVVILGQDPYPDGSFDGLAFSNVETKHHPSPSLRNILKEVEEDIYDGFDITSRTSFNLYRWAEQGVLLLNTAHSVVKNTPGSHLHYWKDFTTEVVKSLGTRPNVIWLLWGNHAHKYEELITNPSHIVIKSGHPSPLNTTNPFKGCKCFSKCNIELEAKGLTPIKW